MELNEFRMIIKYAYLMEKNTVKTQEGYEKCYKESALTKATICH